MTKNNNINPEDHIGLVHMCCQKFKNKNIEYDDLFQSGCEGLAKAAKNFDVTKNVKFSTYAVLVILGEIKSLFRSNNYLKVSRRVKDLSIKIESEREKFIYINSREPTVNELSDLLETKPEEILEALEISKTPVPIENCDNYNNNFGTNLDELEEKVFLKVSISDLIKNLETQDKNIIYLRFFQSSTQSDVAKKLGMTQVQVSRREKYILNLLRNKLS